MPTPKKGYFLKDGTKIPGTTTITSRFKDSGGIIYRAREQGYEQAKRGEPLNHKEWQETAADAGTAAHAMIESHISGKNPAEVLEKFPLEIHRPAKLAFESYQQWEKNFEVKIQKQEIQLISQKYEYGGTPDAVGLVGDKLALLDWKTSKVLYKDYRIQLAAYLNLLNENFPDDPITGGAHLLMFSKSRSGEFSHHYFPDLSREFEYFIVLREAYRLDKELEK